jgi:protein disulfide-isomerase A6
VSYRTETVWEGHVHSGVPPRLRRCMVPDSFRATHHLHVSLLYKTPRDLNSHLKSCNPHDMLFKNLIPAAIALLPALASADAVLDLTPSNFGDVVLKSGKPALVEFFAPWCGHCKNLAPVYEELATVFQHASDKVTVAKVDADEHKSLGKDYGVSGFPTLKWFDGKSNKPTDYNGGRDLESLSKFITEKTSLKPKIKGKLPSQVTYLDDQSFKQKVGKDQDVLVAFTAPWCGREFSYLPPSYHC